MLGKGVPNFNDFSIGIGPFFLLQVLIINLTNGIDKNY